MTGSVQPRVTATLVAVLAVGLGVVGMMAGAAPVYELSGLDLFVLAVAAALGDRLLLPRPRGRSASMAVAVVAAVAVLSLSPPVVAGVAVAAWVAQSVRAVRRGRRLRFGSLLVGAGMAWALGGAMVLAAHADPSMVSVWESPVQVLPIVVLWAMLLFVAPALETVELQARVDRGRRQRYRDLLSGGFASNIVLAATATLGALAYPELGTPTVVLMALPLLAAKLGFDRGTQTRTTYDQTLRAMSRLPEQLGAVDGGHGVRAGEVAALAAVELGFRADTVTDVERAAQLHELGRIRTEHGLELDPEEVAHAGAAIVREAGELDRVARLIAAHRGPVPVGDEEAWVGGAIVRLACDLDLRLIARGTDPEVRVDDEAWLRGQGVQLRIADAVVRAARVHYTRASSPS